MIAIDYLELIEQGVDVWNRWRSEHPDDCPVLESAYLFEKSLPGINLRHANLSRACLIGANLEGADLEGANLSGAYANNANLQRASLVSANLQDGNFIEANLTQADLSGTVTDNANFTNARLEETCLAMQPGTADALPLVGQPEVSSVSLVKPKPMLTVLMGLVGVSFAIALFTVLYLALRPPRFIKSDGTVTLQLVCNEPDVTPINTKDPDHIYQNGIQFYGVFEQGKPANGRGSMLYPNGNRYDGEYRNGLRNGCGTFTFNNSRRYVGEFQDDLFSGRGVWMLENGDRYVGDFEFNKCNGEGVYIFADGTSKSGIWQQGRLVDDDLTCDVMSTDLSVRHHIDLPQS